MPEEPICCQLTLSHADFVMSNHRVHGVSVMPGVTLLDVVLRILAARGIESSTALLSDVLFTEPIATADGVDRMLRVTIASERDGRRDIEIESRAVRGGIEDGGWRPNLVAALSFEDVPPAPMLDIRRLRASASSVRDMAELYAQARREEIVHGAPMRCRGLLHEGPDGLMAELDLDPSVADQEQRFRLHPAKLDAATLVAFGRTPLLDAPYIPIAVAVARAPRRLVGRCYVHVPRAETLASSGDLMHNDCRIYDSEGQLVAELTRLACKRIRSRELITTLAAAPVQPDVTAAPALSGASDMTVGRLVDRITALAASELGIEPGQVSRNTGFYDQGLDSMAMLSIGRALEDVVGAPLYPTLLFEFGNIDSLARHLAAEHGAPRDPAPPPSPAHAAVGAPRESAAPASPGPAAAGEPPREVLTAYRRVWTPQPLQEPAATADYAAREIVLLALDAERGDATAATLRSCGHRVTLAVRDEDFAPAGPGRPYRLDFSRPHVERLLDTLAASGHEPRAFAILAGGEDDGAHDVMWATATALVSRRPTQTTRLFLVADDEDARHAAIGALARTLSAETPVLRCRGVTARGASPADLAAILVDELASPADEAEIRYRAGQREAPSLTPVDLSAGRAVELRRQGVYLLAGGGGGLGRRLASHLLERYDARLVLVARRAPDEELAERLTAWRAAGAQVLYVRADVADPEAAFEAVEQARLRFGGLHGVFHLAGAVDDGVYFAKDPARIDQLLAPKLRGAVNLDLATRDDQLDAFVLFSSISAVMANPGQSDYAYANAFLDHFAVQRSLRPDRTGVTVSIGWPYWANGGMRLDAAAIDRTRRETGFAPLPTAAGLDALAALLAAGAPHLVVSYGDTARIERVLTPVAEPAAEAIELGTQAAPGEARPPGRDGPAHDAPRERAGPRPAPAAAIHEPARSASREVAPLLSAPAAKIDVAIVGLAGTYPQAPDIEAFWRLLAEGRDAITEIPSERWDHEALFDTARGAAGKTYGRWGGFVEGVDRFAPAFFGISRREAESMDPQERLFLRACWQALEDAGYIPERLAGESVGVFAGVMWSHYQLFEGPDGVAPTALHSSIANRVSYCFDFTGPSVAVDTACSSSLVALHLAAQSIRNGEATMALAGGVNVTLHPQKYLQLASDQFLSSDGRCRAFGDGGTGYVPGEGVGVVVLKPLARALADGDHVDAIIRGSTVNHSGRTSGFTVPDPASQARLVSAALRRSGLAARSISYIEAHGTGTSLGDPIEIDGLMRAFASDGLPAGSCAIGSVKSNIGHLESAAGIAGVTKVLLQLRHRELVPSLHAEALNPQIPFASSPFAVQRTRAPWRSGAQGSPLRAGVSAFGAGGANAHLIIEEPPQAAARLSSGDEPELIVLSAPDAGRLRELATALVARLAPGALDGGSASALQQLRERVVQLVGVAVEDVDPDAPLAELGLGPAELTDLDRLLAGVTPRSDLNLDPDATLRELAVAEAPARAAPRLRDIAFTLQVGRRALAVRLAFVACSVADLVDRLHAFLDAAELGDEGCWGIAAEPDELDLDASELLAEGRLSELARAWVDGAAVEWPARRGDGRRVSLPVTPLAEERCWIGGWAQRSAPSTQAAKEEELVVEVKILPDGIALLTMSDEARGNTFTDELLGGLERSLAEVAARDDVRAIVLTGTDRIFCTGGTPEALAALAAQEATFTEATFVYEGLLRCDKPVLSAIRGQASGGGLAFGLYADVVVLSREGSYSANFLKHGFTPGLGASFVLEHRLGATLAAEMMLTCGTYSGAELERRGAQVLFAAPDDVLPLALDRARSMAALPVQALGVLKAELARRTLDRLPEVIASELSMHDRVLGDGAAELVRRRFTGNTGAGSTGAGHAGNGTVAHDADRSPAPAAPPARPDDLPVTTIVEKIVRALCAHLYAEPHEIHHDRSLSDMGLDSIAAVEIVRDLNEAFGTDIDSVAVYDHPTVTKLADLVLSVRAQRRAVHDAAAGEPAETSMPAAVAGSRAQTVELAPPAVISIAAATRVPEAQRPASVVPLPRLASTSEAERRPKAATEIAVIGMSGRFPDADDLDAFWENLAAGSSAIREIPPERWDSAEVFDPNVNAPGKSYSRWAAMLSDVESFDHRFFNVSPLEAEEMDPQQRIFLTECWKALEDAGYAGATGEGQRCGVFAGCAPGDYARELTAAERIDSGTAFLGNSSSILASRIAYLLDLRGPSIAIDTACSSSLVAVHLACQSLAAGETDMALAGGVAVMLTPSLHVRSSRVGMLSPSGTCAPFDARADGIVLGEGVGLVVLKRLDDALRDGDHVHGVIRGSGVNGDGKTNGITAPSAAAQARLMRAVHARAGIAPDDITYIEAHGTGTALGDPIEFKALLDVLGAADGTERSCALGSAKANIGHTTMAAGIAGLLKVLLALRHRELPPSAGFAEPNPKIDLDASTLWMVAQRQPWTGRAQGQRIATVSSFGFSGTNCHIVVGEAPEMPRRDGERAALSQLVPVSARTPSELDAQLGRLAAALTPEHDLGDVAFTLATGRRHLAVRAAIVATSVQELRAKLAALAAGSLPPGCARGAAAAAMRAGPQHEGEGAAAELQGAAVDYVSGLEPDWPTIFAGRRNRRVPLPVYPFNGVRHRVANGGRGAGAGTGGGTAASDGYSAASDSVALHPGHPLVADHRLGATPVLPGAATLEVVAAAARDHGLTLPLRLGRVRWLRPFEVSAARSLTVSLTPTPDGFAYRLGDDNSPHGTGMVSPLAKHDTPPPVDVDAALGRAVRAHDIAELYADFDRAGLRYGPSFRLLNALASGPNEAVGTIATPDGGGPAVQTALLDAGLQAIAALVDDTAPETLVPVGARTIELHAALDGAAHAIARDRGTQGYDVDLTDREGNVLARVAGLVLRPADKLAGKTYAPTWRELDPAPAIDTQRPGRVTILFSEPARRLAYELVVRLPGADTVRLDRDARHLDLEVLSRDHDAVYVLILAGDGAGPPEQDASASDLLAIVRALVTAGHAERPLTLKVVVDGAVAAAPDEGGRPNTAALVGLTRTIAAEHPGWRVGCIDIGAGPGDQAGLAVALTAEDCGERLVALRSGRRLVRALEPLLLAAPAASPFRERGIYLLLGGAGGIGSALSLHLARAMHARLVWIGRREEDDEIRRRMSAVDELGGQVLYLRADAADLSDLMRAVDEARRRFGPINGAFHTAAVLRDRMLVNMQPDDLEQVLAPKVRGLANLRRALEGEPLDFLACFSSAAAFVDSAGQGNYAAASTFEDALAVHLRRTVGLPITVVNWGYWGSVGAVADDFHRARLAADGVGSIEPQLAMMALERALAARVEQLLVIEAAPAGLAHLGIRTDARSVTTAALPVGTPAAPADYSGVAAYVRRVFAEVLKHGEDDLDAHTTFEEFGVDSVIGAAIVERFQRDLGRLPSTLLFEEMTIDHLARRLLRDHGEALAALPDSPALLSHTPATPAAADPLAVAPARGPRLPAAGPRTEDVAVVGVTGRYPQAPDLATLWHNLAAGASGITEVPAERWDWRATADPNRGLREYQRWGGFLDHIDCFDAGLFGILPRDAVSIDPQERLFLETCWILLEQAGYLGHSRETSTGVFVGLMYGTYGELGARAARDGTPTGAHSAYWSVANRVSYTLDLTGPSLAVDSACSSSLTAVHLACESIRRGECRMAIAGGVNLILHPSHFLDLGARNMLASDGAVKVFDAGADGYVPGEGVGAVLLKPLSEAVDDGDEVWAVIKGATMNAGGKTSGYTVPNPNAQAALVAGAIRRAGVDPRTISYVEAHGSGTELGDPIEIAGTAQAFAALGGDAGRCAIGSVKSNIGHLEGAAGIAGLTKVLLQMQHEQLVPTVNLGVQNPKIDFASSPFSPQRSLERWTRPRVDLGDGERDHPLRAGVSSFGAGGANVHIVLEEHRRPSPRWEDDATQHVVVLSAPDRERLAEHAAAVAAFLSETSETPALAELAYTSQVGRRAFRERLAVVARDLGDLTSALGDFGRGVSSELVLLADDRSGAEPAEHAYASRDLRGLAMGWVEGAVVDWSRLWPDRRPRRVPFPGTPMRRSRYWVEQPRVPEPERAPAPDEAVVSAASGRKTRVRCERPVWEPAPVVEGAGPVRSVIVVGADDKLGAAIAERLAAGSIDHVVVATGAGARSLVDSEDASAELPDAIVYVAAGRLSSDGGEERPTDTFQEVLELATGVLRRAPRAALRVLCVRLAAAGDEQPHLIALAGLLKTLAQEHRCRGATLALAPGDANEVAERILDELRWMQDDEVAYDLGVRQVKRMREFDRPVARGDWARTDGTYLVTGGAGALGLHVAGLLARRGAGEVVLVGRAELDPTRAALIQELGADVRYVRADVASADAVERLVVTLRGGSRPLRGVIHAAGVIRDGRALDKAPAQIDAVLAPKIEGALNLDRATAGDALDFFVLFSSIVGQTGNRGQSDYAYANAYLDAFAATRERWREAGIRRGRTLSIGWSLWRDGGMTVDSATAELLERRWGMVPMSTEAGLSAFEALLAGSEHVATVVETLVELASRIAPPAPSSAGPPAAPASSPTTVPAAPASSLTTPAAVPTPSSAALPADLVAQITTDLRAIAARFLLVDPAEVDPRAELPELGFDSISMTDLVQEVNTAYGLELLPTVLFECVTLTQLADHLTSHHSDAIRAATGAALHHNSAVPAPDVAAPAKPIAMAAPRSIEPADIAVIGTAGIMPGSADLEEFWRHLADGRDLVRHVPEDREELLDDPRTRHLVGGFLDRVGDFDAELFGISPREAALMDPQQRLFLQTAWMVIADAGYRADDLAGTATGLFAGVSTSDYDDLLTRNSVPVEAHTATGVSHAVLANRVSHVLDLRGPSEAVDSACSSALVAVHRAVRALRGGECDLALAGGVGVTLTPGLFVAFMESGMLSPSGRCATFDNQADGYVRGEGAGAVLLKPLAHAVADGDHVHAVIRGSAVNHGGRAASLTAPNPRAQAEVLAAAYADARIEPATVSYFETHGTGTKLGDPIEIEGLKKLLAGVEGEATIAIGSVKTNIGHLEAAAGIAGLLKVLLAIRHGQLPPHLHLQQLNPHVRLAGTPLTVNERLRPWPGPGRHAGVSSFGFGGTNAHVVVTEPPPYSAVTASGPRVLVLSAPDRRRLARYASRIADRLRVGDAHLDDVMYTLQVGREEQPERLAVVAADRAGLIAGLQAATEEAPMPGVHHGTATIGSPPPAQDSDDALAAAWVAGAEFDWAARWSGRPHRVALPTFELAPTRHWFTHPSQTGSSHGITVPHAPLPSPSASRTPAPRPVPHVEQSPDKLAAELRANLAELLAIAPEDIAGDQPFERLGLDSIFAMDFAERLRDRHSCDIQAVDLYEINTIDALAARLARRPAALDLLAQAFQDILGRGVDPACSFDDEGLTSLDMLRVISELEAGLGPLPKTLLYDHPDLGALASHLGDLYGEAALVSLVSTTGRAEPAAPEQTPAASSSTVVPKRRLHEHPEIAATVAELTRVYGVESGLAGRDIAPLLLVGRGNTGYLEFAEHRSAALAWSYTGQPRSYAGVLAEFATHARNRGLAPNVLSPSPLAEIAETPCSATPFGVVQTLDLSRFSLQGGRMRRLRGVVNNFNNHATAEVLEVDPGQDRAAAQQVIELVDDWTASKPVVNPYVQTVREQLRAGDLGPDHRIFLTSVDTAPIAAVVLTSMPAERGYLLDVEFYRRDMPVGGLEVTIVQLIELLSAEGVELLSLGATFGVKVGDSPNASPAAERALEELRSAGMSGIGNYQFKSKFRPDEMPIYLCQPANNPTDVGDVMLMIATPPSPMTTPESPPRTAQLAPTERNPPNVAQLPKAQLATERSPDALPEPRMEQLAAIEWNPLRLTHDDVEIDLVTDSWAERGDPWISARNRRLGELEGATAQIDAIRQPWLPFPHVVPTPNGRTAEALLCRALGGLKRIVLHNGLFPTWLSSLAEHRFTPVALAGHDNDTILPGDVPLTALDAAMAQREGDIAFVVVELACNSSGGLPLSLSNLEQVRSRTTTGAIPLVLDATRIVGNAIAIDGRERDADGDVWAIVRDLLALADAATISLSKEFCVSFGGLLASNVPEVTKRLADELARRGLDVSLSNRRLLQTALTDTDEVLAQVRMRREAVAALRGPLVEASAPLAAQDGGHCVLLDAGRLPGLGSFAQPVEATLAWIYEHTGIRGGPHLADPDAHPEFARCIRLAVPLGMSPKAAQDAGERIAALLQGGPQPVDLRAVGGAPGRPQDARFRPRIAPDRAATRDRPVRIDGSVDRGRGAADAAEPVQPQWFEQQLDELGASLQSSEYAPANDNLDVLREFDPRVECRMVAIDGGEVEVFTLGSGPPVLLMHPFNIGAGMFGPQLAGLADRFSLVVVHQPGVGRTRVARELSMEGIAMLQSDVLSALGVPGPIHVGGASVGAIFAQYFALRFPDRTRSLSLLGGSYKFANRKGQIDRLEQVIAEDFDLIPGGGAAGAAADRERVTALLLRCESMDPREGLRYIDLFAQEAELTGRLGEIAVPTLVVQGRHDSVVGVKTGHFLHGAIPDARYVELSDSGHFLCMTEPDLVNRELTTFLLARIVQ